MNTDSTEIFVTARYSSLPVLMQALLRTAEQIDFPAELHPRLQLVLEELFANSLNHGYGGECDETVSAAFFQASGKYILRYCDTAPPFDLSQVVLHEPSTTRLGGLGLNLIHAYCQPIRYQRSGHRNVSELTF